MTKMFDLDGVLRDLSGNFLEQSPEVWHWFKEGKDIYDYINADLTVLATSKPTKFYHLVADLPQVNIITSQPKNWRPYTTEWICNHFENNVSVKFVDSPEEKLEILERENACIFEDYPNFKDYSRVYLIDYPYNRAVVGCIKRITTVDEMAYLLGLQKGEV
jgi:hypothetical protein